MKENNNFQIIIVVIFVAAAVFGLLVFSGMINIGNDDAKGSQGTVVLWGTASSSQISSVIQNFNKTNKTFILKYEEKDPETFDQDLLEALAAGVGPDLFLLPENLIYRYKDKIFTIPYESSPEALFKSSFVGAAEIFMTTRGILALPLSIDPMVMYYNRSVLDSNGIIYPPTNWNELSEMAPLLTKTDDSKKVIKSAVGMGQFSNINHAKDIIANLFLQSGNKIISEKPDGTFISLLNQGNISPVLEFYTNFSDPSNSTYSWNKSLPNSIDLFSSEDLVFYIGFASELKDLINRNPNQNFSVATIPQIKDANFKLTYAHVTGIAISSFSKNFNTAFTAASLMSTGTFAKEFNEALSSVPAKRDLLAMKPTDSFFPVFYSSALFARSWLDPSPVDTDNIFRGMVEGVLSNTLTADAAIKDGWAKLNLLLLGR